MGDMDIGTVHTLRQLDNRFYRENASSFSETRQHAWPGWERVADSLPAKPRTVLDMACGNMRFKTFVDERFEGQSSRYYGVDSCSDLLPECKEAEFQHLDVIEGLLENTLPGSLTAPACDLVACFAFMHHVPTKELRLRLLDVLLEKAQAKGIVALSFWQFAQDGKALEKARATTRAGCAELGLRLDNNDFLLGWKDVEGAYRYCHSFTDGELDEFAAHCEGQATLVNRFRADGKTATMNGYLVFRKLV